MTKRICYHLIRVRSKVFLLYLKRRHKRNQKKVFYEKCIKKKKGLLTEKLQPVIVNTNILEYMTFYKVIQVIFQRLTNMYRIEIHVEVDFLSCTLRSVFGFCHVHIVNAFEESRNEVFDVVNRNYILLKKQFYDYFKHKKSK